LVTKFVIVTLNSSTLHARYTHGYLNKQTRHAHKFASQFLANMLHCVPAAVIFQYIMQMVTNF